MIREIREIVNKTKEIFILVFFLSFLLNLFSVNANVPPVNLWGKTDCNNVYLFYNNTKINANIYDLGAYDLFIPSDDPDTKQIEGFKENELIEIKCNNYSFFIKFPKYGGVFRIDLYKFKLNISLNKTKKVFNLYYHLNKTNEERLRIKIKMNLNNKNNYEIQPISSVHFKPPMNLWGFTYINNQISPNITFKVICNNQTQYYMSNELGFFQIDVFCNKSFLIGIDKVKTVDFISGKSLFINLSDYSKEYKEVKAIDFKQRIKRFINRTKNKNDNTKNKNLNRNHIENQIRENSIETNIWIILDISLFLILILILKLKMF